MSSRASQRTLRFLRGLSQNNNKAWFDAHRDDYEEGIVERPRRSSPVSPRSATPEDFEDRAVRATDQRTIPSESTATSGSRRTSVRTRTTSTSGSGTGEEKGWRRRAWFRLTPEQLTLGAACGFEGDAERYRKAVLAPKSGARLMKLIAAVTRDGYEVGGATRKKVPRGFDAEHERAPLLLHEGLWAALTTKVPREVKSAAFVDTCAEHYARLWPIGKWILDEVAA
jgi:hypothetical protein